MNKKLEAILRTFKQSPDANILLASAAAISYFTDFDALAAFPAVVALKQYYYGHTAYSQTKGYIKRFLDRGQKVNEEAVKRIRATCDYFGSEYALREHMSARNNNFLKGDKLRKWALNKR